MQPISLTTFFESQESWDGQEITVRGFLYQKEGKTILALEPNIPSCCHNKKPFLTLQGDFPTSPQIVLVQGTISGREMHSAKLIEEPSYVKEAAIFFILMVLFFLYMRRRRRDRQKPLQ